MTISVDGLELVRLHRGLVLVEVAERVLGAVMVGVVIGIYCLMHPEDHIRML